MSFEDFHASLTRDAQSPAGLSAPLRALWHDGQGDWDRAHDCLQGDSSTAASWVHAYLHRKEGDLGNAGYWYARAGQTLPRNQSLAAEWQSIAQRLLAAGDGGV
jgi:hypothetical protein